mgnify:CR=1 FL=1
MHWFYTINFPLGGILYYQTRRIVKGDVVYWDFFANLFELFCLLQVLSIVRSALLEEPKDTQEPDDDDDDDEVSSGLLYIHAMRLADIFSDDSNFRIFVMDFLVGTSFVSCFLYFWHMILFLFPNSYSMLVCIF